MSGVAPSVRRLSAAALLLLLSACAGTQNAPVTHPAAAERAAGFAQKMVGKPYKYGGASPSGFDCSGLVQYSYRQAGVALPHNTEQLRRRGAPVRVSQLRPGDL